MARIELMLTDQYKSVKLFQLKVPNNPKNLKREIVKFANDKNFISICDKSKTVETKVTYDETELQKQEEIRTANFIKNCTTAKFPKKMMEVFCYMNKNNSPDYAASHFEIDRNTINTHINRAKQKVYEIYPKEVFLDYKILLVFLNSIWSFLFFVIPEFCFSSVLFSQINFC